MILLTSVYRQLMIRLSSITEAISFVFVFLLTIGLQKSFSEVREQHHHDRRSDKTKIRIVLLLIVLLALSAVTYTQRCYGHTDLLECFYI
jgi:putative copper export protein